MKLSWKNYLPRHDVIYETPARIWQDGTPLGNGSLAAVAFEPNHLEWTINKNDVWDYRHPKFRRHSMKRMREIVAKNLAYRKEMAKEDGPDVGRYPCPKTGGQLRIRFGFDSIYSPAHRVSKRLSLYEATLRTHLDKHLSHPRISSFICAEENVLVIQARAISAVTAFHNKVDLHRVPDSEMPAAKRGAKGDTIWIDQPFHDGFRFVLMAKVVPRGGTAYRDFFRKTVQKKWWNTVEPSKKITGKLQGEFAVVSVAGDFDVFVTIVTSRESRDPLAAAGKKLAAAAQRGSEALHVAHRRWWAKYWTRNYIGLSEPLLEQLWYVSQYNLATVLPGTPVGGLCGLWYGPMDTPSQILPWRGYYTNDYNAQLPIMPVFRLNRPELADGAFRTLLNMLPQAIRNARELYRLPGAFYPLATDPTGADVSSGPYRFCQGSGPYWSVFMWWHFLYTGNLDYLRQVTYPIMREVAVFFSNYLVWHENEKLYHLEISQNPELMYIKYPDPVDTLAFVKYTFKAVIQATQLLKRDTDLATKLRHILDYFPSYAHYEREISPLRGLRSNHMNHMRTLATVFPCAEFNPPPEPGWQKLCRAELLRTDQWSVSYDCNEGQIGGTTGRVYHAGVPAVRLGMKKKAWKILEDLLKSNVKPNGLISHNSSILVSSDRSEKNLEAIPNIEAFHDLDSDPLKADEILNGRLTEWATESLDCRDTVFPALEGPACYLLIMGEILLRTDNGVLRLFSALPKKIDASFVNLRAEGPTLISAVRRTGSVRFIRLKALAVATWKIENPWGKTVWTHSSRSNQSRMFSAGKFIEVLLSAGEEITFAPGRPHLKEQVQPGKDAAAKPRSMSFADKMICWVGKPKLSVYYDSLERARKGRRRR